MLSQLCRYQGLIAEASSFINSISITSPLTWQTIAKNRDLTHHPHTRDPVETESMESERKGGRVIQLRRGREESERKDGQLARRDHDGCGEQK